MVIQNFKIGYFFMAAIILLVEVCIAVFMNDAFIRPFVGDYLAVMFLYYLFASFVEMSPLKISLIVLLIAYLIEGLQLIQFLKIVGWEHHKLLRIVLGSSFDWGDMVAYTLGILTILFIHSKKQVLA